MKQTNDITGLEIDTIGKIQTSLNEMEKDRCKGLGGYSNKHSDGVSFNGACKYRGIKKGNSAACFKPINAHQTTFCNAIPQHDRLYNENMNSVNTSNAG